MLDVRKLQVLRAVVTSGSVSAAATNLGCTPSAVSQQIAALQRQAGMALLEKEGRGVRPTAAGRLLTEHATEIMTKLTEAETALADLRAGRTGRLRVRSFATAGAAFLPPAVAAFRREHPTVQLDLRLTEPDEPLSEVLSGRADIAITVIPDDSVAPGVTLLHLLDDPFRVVLPRGHRLAHQPVISMSELAGEQWVDSNAVQSACRQVVIDAFACAGIMPSVALTADDYPTTQGFVAADLGFGLIPDLGLGSVHPGVVVRRLRNPEPVRHIHVAVGDGRVGQPAADGFVRALVAAAGHTPANPWT